MIKMTHKIQIYRSGELICKTEGKPGETLHHLIRAAGVLLNAPCGGNNRCGKCRVRLSPDGEQILACRTTIDGDTNVYLPDETKAKIAGAGTVVSPTERIMKSIKPGVAIDIGTTMVVAHLTDTLTGTRIATASGINTQQTYGADVISRIRYCADNGHEALTQLIREQLASLINQSCADAGICAQDIEYVSIAGNTIMQHFAAGYSPVGMGTAPFLPISLFGDELPVWEGLSVAKTAKVYFAPAVSSYVGGDITAGMLAAGLGEISSPAVYLDIGTNGEIVLKANDIYYCCATAAGPAFEGAETTMGMPAVEGAIDHVIWENGLKTSVIGDSDPRGLCGSGLLDALALLLETGAVDETGRLLDAGEINHEIAAHIGKVESQNVFWLTKSIGGVYMSAMDIRKLQLAKSAIAAGIQTLLHHAKITEGQVKKLILAGGFGSYINKTSAAQIGLFPKSLLKVAQSHGNTAGEGASLALCSEHSRARLEEIRKRCKYIELSTSPEFNEQFIEQMGFET